MRSLDSLKLAVAVAALVFASATAQAQDWKPRWDAVVAAAEKEGQLDVSGPSGKLWHDQLMAFHAAYPKIRLNVTPQAGRDFWPRLIKEREVGQNLCDLRIGGADTEVYEFIEQGALAD